MRTYIYTCTIYLSVCLSIYLCLSIYIYIDLSIYVSIFVSLGVCSGTVAFDVAGPSEVEESAIAVAAVFIYGYLYTYL